MMVVVICNLISAFICYEYSQKFVKYLLALNSSMSLVYLSPPELFLAYIKLAFIAGIILASPVTFYQLWMFISPALKKDEKCYIAFSLFAGAGFFTTGVTFAYAMVLPTMLKFFSRIQMAEVTPMLSVGSYLDFVNSILFTFGLVFEMPLLIALLAKLKIVRAEFLRKKQPVLILLIFIIAAFITPPDVVSQIMLAVPMVFLLQLSIGICWIINRAQDRKIKEEDELYFKAE